MNYGTSRLQIVLGSLVLAAFFAITVAVLVWMRSDPRLFGSTRDLHARLPEHSGLQIGDPVEIDGVRVGTVKAIRREVEAGVSSFLIRCAVRNDAEALTWLGPASRARARTANLLGDVVLSISGDAEGHGVDAEHAIPGEAAPSFDRVLADVEAATSSVRAVTSDLEAALGTKDETGVARAERIAQSIERTTGAFEQFAAGNGSNQVGGLAQLLAELGTSAANLRQITEDVRTVTERVRSFFGQ